ncbi:MAG: hypothetical protein ACFB9M_14705 [Myxococcota bacterium]
MNRTKQPGKFSILPRVVAACALALVTAIASSLTVARFAPWSESERLLASAVLFPLFWVIATIFLLVGRRWGRRFTSVAVFTVALCALTAFG